MQTRNPLFDDLARLASGAMGTAQSVKEEMEVLIRSRMERWAADMAFATREEVDAAMAAATAAEARIAALNARVADLERSLADAGGRPVGGGSLSGTGTGRPARQPRFQPGNMRRPGRRG